MNKVYGTSDDFAYVSQDTSRTIIGYNMTAVDDTHYEWNEVYIYKKTRNNPSFAEVKQAIIDDINARTDESILSGFVWNEIGIYLSSENQFNFKAAYDLAVQTEGATLPITFKMGETTDEDGNVTPVYYSFEDMTTFSDFYTKSVAYINECLNAGWTEKDGMDYTPYETALAEL